MVNYAFKLNKKLGQGLSTLFKVEGIKLEDLMT